MPLLGVPTNLTATVLSSSEVQLNWNVGFEDEPVPEADPPNVKLFDNQRVDPIGEVLPTETSFKVVGLQPGVLLTFSVCFIYKTNGQKCTSSSPVQTGPGTGGQGGGADKPPPVVTAAQPFPATLKQKARIRFSWQSSHTYDLFNVRFADNSSAFQNEEQIEIDSGGNDGFFDLQPTKPGRIYDFKVQGCDRAPINLGSSCSPFSAPIKASAAQPLSSLRQFLDGLDGSQGIRALAPGISSVRALMGL